MFSGATDIPIYGDIYDASRSFKDFDACTVHDVRTKYNFLASPLFTENPNGPLFPLKSVF